MKKRAVLLILAVALLLCMFNFCTMAKSGPVTVELDGVEMVFDVEAKIVDGRTMLPMRKIFEEIGALVKWNEDTQTVLAKKSSKEISMKINSKELIIDKGEVDENNNPVTQTILLDSPAIIENGRTLVSVRAVCEAFGLEVSWDESTKTVKITSNKTEDNSWKENVGEIDLSTLTYTGDGIETSDSGIEITKGGDFTLKGTLKDKNIHINTEDKVKIRLENVSITSNNEPCIYVENADKMYITIKDGTKNTLSASISEKGAIYSKDNLEIKGKGELFVNSSYHGIKASDNLTIENGNISITSKKDGINVNDTFKMTGGTVDITSETDGIDCESIVIIEDGTLDITTTAQPITSTTSESQTEKDFSKKPPFENEESVEFAESAKGIKADWMMLIKGGNITVSSTDHAIHCSDEIQIAGGNFTLNSEYKKGISAHGNLTVDGKDTNINVLKSTEGLESKNILTIENGNIKISASDDGINATGGNSGEMQAPPNQGGNRPFGNQKNEEAQGDFEKGEQNRRDERPTPPTKPKNPPFENENAPDFNKENIPQKEQPKENNDFPKDNKRTFKDCLIINGGNLEIYAEDDCIDSNGNLIVNGGVIKATKSNGAFFGNFGIFDSDGELTVGSDAVFVLATLQGEEKALNTPQNSIVIYCDNEHQEDEKIVLTTSDGTKMLTYTPSGNYKAVLIASNALKVNESYTVTIGNESYSVLLKEQKTTVGNKTLQNKQPRK